MVMNESLRRKDEQDEQARREKEQELRDEMSDDEQHAPGDEGDQDMGGAMDIENKNENEEVVVVRVARASACDTRRLTRDAVQERNPRLTSEEAKLLFEKDRHKGVNLTKGMFKTETRKTHAEAERRHAIALVNKCLVDGVTIEVLQERATPMHEVAGADIDGVPGVIVAMRRGLATWALLQHAHNSSKVRQQRRRLQKLKHNLEERVARMLTIKLPETLAEVQREFVAAVRANLAGAGVEPEQATDDELNAAMETAIMAGAHLTRTVKTVPRSPASRAAEKKGSLRAAWGSGQVRPQLSEEEMAHMKRNASSARDTKIFVSVRTRLCTRRERALTRLARARSFIMTGTQPHLDSATHRPTPTGRLSADFANE